MVGFKLKAYNNNNNNNKAIMLDGPFGVLFFFSAFALPFKPFMLMYIGC